MSMVGGLFSGSKGTNFESSAANIPQAFDQTGVFAGNAATANAVQQQQDLVHALNAQNGLGNQASVFNQLQGVANGTGPNPAQAMLNQSTGQNVANQAAMMASQRGTSANPGMIARQAAQQGANIQQQAAGQGATMQANQRLGALGQLGALANQQVANQIGGVQGLNTVSQGQESLYNQGLANQTNAAVGMQSNQNNNNAAIANTNAQAQAGMVNGLMNGGGMSSLMGGGGGGAAMGAAKGGMIRNYDDGGLITPPDPLPGPQSSLGQSLLQPNIGQSAPLEKLPAEDQGQGKGPGSGSSGGGKSGGGINPMMLMMLNKGGNVPAMVSPGERYLSPGEVKKVATGQKSAINAGEEIPGKPKVGGAKDDYANDTVRKTLESGGVVLPRHVTQAKDPAKEAQKFVAAVLAKQRLGK